MCDLLLICLYGYQSTPGQIVTVNLSQWSTSHNYASHATSRLQCTSVQCISRQSRSRQSCRPINERTISVIWRQLERGARSYCGLSSVRTNNGRSHSLPLPATPTNQTIAYLPELRRIFETFSEVNCRFHCFVNVIECVEAI